jgi:hypothetical protein
MNRFLRRTRQIAEAAVGPAFRIRAIRRFAMGLAVPADFRSIEYQNFPKLEEKHLDNPTLFSERRHLIGSMRPIVEDGLIAEVGVAEGHFSEYLLNELRPKRLFAFDMFTGHERRIFGGRKSKIAFHNISHRDFYQRRFADRGQQVVIEEGLSYVNLVKYPNSYFDLIYIDADHSYDVVKQDANIAKYKLAHGGSIVFDDYTILSPYEGMPYGVVQAVNELVVREDWRVCGFALDRDPILQHCNPKTFWTSSTAI